MDMLISPEHFSGATRAGGLPNSGDAIDLVDMRAKALDALTHLSSSHQQLKLNIVKQCCCYIIFVI